MPFANTLIRSVSKHSSHIQPRQPAILPIESAVRLVWALIVTATCSPSFKLFVQTCSCRASATISDCNKAELALVSVLCRWGNQLSLKMFVGKDFVLKHIRVKHGEKVEEFKQGVCQLLNVRKNHAWR